MKIPKIPTQKPDKPPPLTHEELEKFALEKPDPTDDPDAERYAEEDEYSKKVAAATQAQIDQCALDRNTPKTNDTKHYVTMADYGAKGDNTTDDSAAFDAAIAAASAGDTIYVPRGTYKLSNNVTIPSGMEVEFENGALLDIDAGIAFTVNGTLKAGDHEIFTGAGQNLVSLADDCVVRIHAEWWGNDIITGFTTNDATPSVNHGTYFKTTNTSNTTITMLDDGFKGQLVGVVIDDTKTTVDFTGSNMKGNGGVDWSPTTGDCMFCLFDGTDWRCVISLGGFSDELKSLTDAEIQQLQNIGATTISAAQWGYVGAATRGEITSAVSAYLGTNQSVTAAGGTEKVELDTENYDILGEFDPTTNHRFTATAAGKYLVCAQVRFLANAAGETVQMVVKKNGSGGDSGVAGGWAEAHSSIAFQTRTTKVVDLSASDYLELYVNVSLDDTVVSGDRDTFMTITRLH